MSEIDNEVLETTISNEELELDTELEDTEDVEALKEQAAKKDAFARQALARAKKAEAELKTLKGSKLAEATQLNNQNNLTAEDVEVRILKAQGIPQEEIDYLKKLAKVNDTSIIEAQSDELFKSFQTKRKEQEKSEQAKLGASRGSGGVKKEKTFNSQGLSEEEHKALWKQAQGR